MRKFLLLAGLFLAIVSSFSAFSQERDIIRPRIRVIIDNDFGGDPDGLFQLAEQLLSPSTEVKGIVCSHHYKEFYGYPGDVGYAAGKVRQLLETMGKGDVPVYAGSDSTFASVDVPLESEGARFIVKEAMEDDSSPLYVLCGAGLTNIASAWLMVPEISKRIAAVVWIGGPEYPSLCKNQLQTQREYNQGIDPISSQVVFNKSDLNIWQIPRDVYRQALYSYAELRNKVGASGKTGEFLMSCLEDLFIRAGGRLGEAYVLGDSPLVLVTSLQSSWEQDASSCEYVIAKTPVINDRGFYDENPDGRPIRIFTKIDSRLIIEDLCAKLSHEN